MMSAWSAEEGSSRALAVVRSEAFVFRDDDGEDTIRAILESMGIPEQSLCKVILLGATGSGKSFLGNLLCQDPTVFRPAYSPVSVTHEIERVLIPTSERYGKPVLIYDLPPMCDPFCDSREVVARNQKILRAFRELPEALCAPVVVSLGCASRFTRLDMHIINTILHFITTSNPENAELLTVIGNCVEAPDLGKWERQVAQILVDHTTLTNPHVVALPPVGLNENPHRKTTL